MNNRTLYFGDNLDTIVACLPYDDFVFKNKIIERSRSFHPLK